MIAVRPIFVAPIVRVGDFEACSFTGDVVLDRRRREWQIFSCGTGRYRAQMGIDRSPTGSLSEARAWAAEQGVVSLDAGETKAVVLGLGAVLVVAFLYGMARLVF